MFKDVTLNFDSPVCFCDQQNLSWGLVHEDEDSKNGNQSGFLRVSLHVWCKTCEAKVVIPHKKIGAFFKFEKPYPGGVKAADKTKEDKESTPEPEQLDRFFDAYERQMQDKSGLGPQV